MTIALSIVATVIAIIMTIAATSIAMMMRVMWLLRPVATYSPKHHLRTHILR